MAGRGSAAARSGKGKPPVRRERSLVPQAIAGGGRRVFIPGGQVVGWVQRFAVRNQGLAAMRADASGVHLTAADGTTAELLAPFGPMPVEETGDREPLEVLLDHVGGIGALGILLVRGGAHSIGIARDGAVIDSSTHRAYLQGRTAAGGWSQQRFARRRGNQRDASMDHAADLAARVLLPGPDNPEAAGLTGLVVGGDKESIGAVLEDRRLAPLLTLPRRTFLDIPEPRRVVLDEIAERALLVEILIRPAPDTESG